MKNSRNAHFMTKYPPTLQTMIALFKKFLGLVLKLQKGMHLIF
jgi:hypothetical protein